MPLLLALLFITLVACGDSKDKNPVSPDADRSVAGVAFGPLFAPPTADELAQVRDQWRQRDVSPQDVRLVFETSLPLGTTPATLRIFSHRVAGIEHIGAVLAPNDAAPGSLPVLVYNHGGDDGVDINEILLISLALEELRDGIVYVLPAFRAQSLSYAGQAYPAGGQPSPWDLDVDDTLALLNVALANTPAADPERIATLGFSSGAGISLLMSLRDSRIKAVVDYFGPTDFLAPFLQDVVTEALEGMPRDLPYIDFLSSDIIAPVLAGQITPAQLRFELIRRSALYFAADLPHLQAHHGIDDTIIPYSQTQLLIDTMDALSQNGRDADRFESFLYQGGGHHPLTIPESLPRVRDFLSRVFLSGNIGTGGT
jgi:acetyl esterase/lipase